MSYGKIHSRESDGETLSVEEVILESYDTTTRSFKSGAVWAYQVAAKGTLGANIDVTPSPAGDKKLIEMVVNSPLALTDATLKIYKDSVGAGNLLFDGYMMNRDNDGGIKFPTGEICTTKWIVLVSGSTNDVFVLARYQ